MDFVPNDLLVFLVRWAHVIAGIMWIGNSFYFMWLDANLELPADADPELEGSLWMTHSGGFYTVERRKIAPGKMPAVLHWFKWEATLTWVTGFFLLGLVFYARNASLLMNHDLGQFSALATVGVSVAMLLGSWVIYDLLWISPLVKKEWAATAVSFCLVVGIVTVSSYMFSGRGAFIQLGAIFGTLMVLNVWVRILPAQRAMIAATEKGQKPDFTLAKKAKHRSTHNSYMTLPVLFAMLGGHFSEASNHHYRVGIILLFVVLGMICRHIMILKTKNLSARWWFVPCGLTLVAMAWLLHQRPEANNVTTSAQVTDVEAFAIVQQRCVSCHATNPTDPTFGPMPGGMSLERQESMIQFVDKIYFMAVETKTMPLANKTAMTDQEREKLGQWARKIMQK